MLRPHRVLRGLSVWHGLFRRVPAGQGLLQVSALGACSLLCHQLVERLTPAQHLPSLVDGVDLRTEMEEEMDGQRLHPTHILLLTCLLCFIHYGQGIVIHSAGL